MPKYLDVVLHDPFAPDFELRYDAANGIAWSVGKDGNFNPLVEKSHGLSRFEIDFGKYAVRLDGKPQELRKVERSVEKKVPSAGSPTAEK